ncbi:hypothetical protein [Vibrio sp. MA40-2]|uniref:hypothetical protein n=1 Tax=Vibrio sp. MA40-2 TaxID=3391828 RepID=UPI0039A52D31
MVDTPLRINDVIEITGISRRAVYNAMDSGKLAFQETIINGHNVRVFTVDAILSAFPRLSAIAKDNARLRAEVAALKFANEQLTKAFSDLESNDSAMISEYLPRP